MNSDFFLPGFSTDLIKWFKKNKRDLPWRKSRDPYGVWISEIMLQQTRVEAVKEYYLSWMKKWPNIKKMAKANEIDVLNAWKGLGYYSRAKNILKTAQIVEKSYSSQLPDSVIELRKLPGIGRYTAGAIASIAYGKIEPIVDGNVARVYARVFERSEIVNSALNQNFYYQIAQDLLPKKDIGDFNQGLMELGALICTPQNPKCSDCPVNKYCGSYKNNSQSEYPVRNKLYKTQKIYRVAFFILNKNKIFLTQREKKGVYFGMWELPGFAIDHAEESKNYWLSILNEEWQINGAIGVKLGEYAHTFTRFKEIILVYSFTLSDQDIQLPGRFVKNQEISDLPMGSVQVKILKELFLK